MLANIPLIIKNISMSEVILDEIRTRCTGYMPNKDVLRHLEPITMIPIIGPFAVGKSTVMQTIIEQEVDFGRVQSFTTRPQRSDEADSEYRFLDDSPGTLGTILSDINSGKLVQYAIHPTTSAIYGSDLRDYQKTYTMLDALSDSVPAMKALPFANIIGITLVSSPAEWGIRARSRIQQVGEIEAQKRLNEAIQGLSWSLDQGDKMIWVNNRKGNLSVTCDEIVGIVRGNFTPDPSSRKIGEQLLKRLKLATN